MASSSAAVEIVEVKDESFSLPNRLRVNLRPTDAHKPHAYLIGDDLDRLLDAIDCRNSPRVKAAAMPRASGIVSSESPSLKQALRKLCISHASELAAIKRSSKLMGSASVSDAETIKKLYAKTLRVQDSISKEREINETQNSKANVASKKKGKQGLMPVPPNASVVNKSTSNIKNLDGSHCRSPNGRINFDGGFAVKVLKGLVSREKGECSQSSLSSSGDCSSSTSISEESNYCGLGSNCNRPHMSKDSRWAAIRDVVKEQGSLGLQNFQLIRRLGCGDIGTVYLAELRGAECLFALKVMDVEFLISRKKMLRAQTEREILQMLDHPFLPTLYTHFVADNLSFLVMEYCSGGDLHVLRQMQPGRTFNETSARFYVAEVLLALEYLHMLGVIYRDLKPENILVRDDGHIMLSDFDLSMRCAVSPARLSFFSLGTKDSQKAVSGPSTGASCIDPFCLQPSWVQAPCFTPSTLSSSTKFKSKKVKSEIGHVSPLSSLVVEPINARSNSFVGTHEYLAPEIIRGDGHGSSVDWWTLGIFLYELMFGRTPFKGSGNGDTLANVVSQGLNFPESPEVGFHAKDLISGLLIKEPKSRLGSARGAAEIKQHPFFRGLNWALIRCAAPPEVPGVYGAKVQKEERKNPEFDQTF